MARETVRETLVVGAGISGLSAAVMLARSGRAVEVWESTRRAGGLLASVPFLGAPCDLGSHRVHLDADPALFALTGSQLWERRVRRGRLVFGGRHLAYPPSLAGLLRGLGPKIASGMLTSFVREPGAWESFVRWEEDRRRPVEHDEGYEDFVVPRVGREAFDGFYRPYVEKVWGEAPGALSRSVAKQRVSSRSPLRSLLPRRDKRTFLYPRGGMARVITELQRELEILGVPIRTDREATLERLGRTSARHILYSGHLGDLVADVRLRSELRHRGLYVVHLAVPARAVGREDTWYAPEASYWFGRVSRPDRFCASFDRGREAILCVEIPEGRWGPGQDFVTRLPELVEQLAQARILRYVVEPSAARQTYAPRVYPIYGRGWTARWSDALRRLGEADERILPIGRQGLFLHCNLDQCVRISASAVRAIQAGETRRWIDRAGAFLDLRVRD